MLFHLPPQGRPAHAQQLGGLCPAIAHLLQGLADALGLGIGRCVGVGRGVVQGAACAVGAPADGCETGAVVLYEEDFNSGYSIADEYTPDQLGVVRKAVYTVCGDFLQALGSAAMQIETGQYRLLAVSSYSKASNVICKEEVLNFAYDPTLGRLGVTPHYLAGIEAQSFLGASGYTRKPHIASESRCQNW